MWHPLQLPHIVQCQFKNQTTVPNKIMLLCQITSVPLHDPRTAYLFFYRTTADESWYFPSSPATGGRVRALGPQKYLNSMNTSSLHLNLSVHGTREKRNVAFLVNNIKILREKFYNNACMCVVCIRRTEINANIFFSYSP